MRKAFLPFLGALFLLLFLCPGVTAEMNLAWKFDFDGLFGQEKPAPAVTLPGAPAEVSVAPVSDSLTRVSWSTGAKATAYRIYRDGKYLVTTSATQLADSGLKGATRYCYQVTIIDAEGRESERSNQACTTTPETPKAASGPLGLTAVAAAETQINLSWNALNGALGYKVYRDGLYLMTATSGTSVPDKDLREAGRYCYQVTAVDTEGKESEKSSPVCAEANAQVFGVRATDVAAPSSVSKQILEKGRAQIDIEFDYNKYDVKPKYHQELKKIGDVMAANRELRLVIEGHTDNVGGRNYNMNLSLRRAEAVRAYIIKNFGVKETHLTAKGYGLSRPIASNKTAAGRQKNRRVEAAVEYTIKK